MSVEYTFSISDDFPNSLLDESRLVEEIRASAITIALDYIARSGDVCSVWFKASLSGGEQTTLAGLVAAHTGEPLAPSASPVTLEGLDMTVDNRIRVQPVTVDRGLWHWFHSAGDDVTNGRCEGDLWCLSADGTEENPPSIEWQYNDWISMTGGIGMFLGAKLGDYVHFKVFCPATVATSTPGSGNANKSSLGEGKNMFVPAVNGDWTIDLSSRDACPVLKDPLPGYWNWDWPNEGVGTVSAAPNANGTYALVDFASDPAVRFIPKVTILGDGQLLFKPENVKPSDVLPHWKLRCELHHNGLDNHVVEFTWHIIGARRNTR